MGNSIGSFSISDETFREFVCIRGYFEKTQTKIILSDKQ